MADPNLYFSRDSYQKRQSKTRDEMVKRNPNLLIVTGPSDMSWLTGKLIR
ncbi:hypothetical protein PEL8287_01794 [Roseovarius litorisediminis]|uniref:Uncharacterized protein n=1 Tax=Roseovarius litorisediminis TaxID=1312363 RepID=A0A1Y5SGT6_9RHOB|nr:hypothetical protein [Roseovarius litorisediminis]SLN37383.1 hypothetical protein PEL8287_01794 [Roseovarius litorisediminis]